MAKPLRKAMERLERRQRLHDISAKADKDDGRGMTKPGSMTKSAAAGTGRRRRK